MQLEDGPNSVQRVYDELALLGKIFIKEIDEDLQPPTPNRIWQDESKRDGN